MPSPPPSGDCPFVAAPGGEPASTGRGDGAPRLIGSEVWTRLAQAGLAPARAALDRYHGARLLGVGSTGTVYSIVDESLRRRVAIKLLHADAAGDPERLGEFIDEAQITAALKHPNVLPVFDLELTAAGQPFFSMGETEGVTLAELIERSTPDRRDPAIAGANALVSIFIAVCNAIAYAHHQRIVHQDIKPQNILVGRFGEVLVLDWGAALRLDAHAADDIAGTPLYMSPEQARRERVDERSDVYAIGATLFHALTLRPPTWAEESQAFWRRKSAGEVDAPDAAERRAIAAPLMAIALKAMAADPSSRYPTAEALRRDLENYQAGFAVSALRDPHWLRLRRWYRANTRLFWALAAAVIATTSTAGLYASIRLAERSAWTPVVDERFDEASLADLTARWRVRTQTIERYPFPPFAEASVDDSSLFALTPDGLRCSTGDYRVVDLSYRPGVSGDVCIEWTCRALGEAKNLNCFIGGPDRTAGFTIHVGAFGDRRLVTLTRGEEHQLVHAWMREPLRSGRTYAFALEHDDRHLRFRVDGRELFDYVDVDSVATATLQQFGFDNYPINQVAYGRVHVDRRVPGQRISPLEVGDRLAQFRHWGEAELQYQGILDAYPTTDLAVAAEYRVARCALEQGRRDEAARRFDAFTAAHPRSELAPLAVTERLAMATADGQRTDVERLRTQLVDYAGDPALVQPLIDLGAERARSLGALHASAFDESRFPADILARIDGELATMRRWSTAYRLPLTMNPLNRAAMHALNRLGRHEQALGVCTMDSERQECLVRLGRFDEALAFDTGDDHLRARALDALGRFDDVVADTSIVPVWRARAAYVRGDDDEGLARVSADDDVLWAHRLEAGRFEDYLAAHPTDFLGPDYGLTTRVRVLIAAGHADRVLAEYHHLSAIARALLAQGDLDQALAKGGYDRALVAMVALRRLENGQAAMADALIERLASAPVDHDSPSDLFDLCLLPAVAAAISGDRQLARERLRAVEAREHDTFGLRCRFMAQYLLGEIDDSAFLAQPTQALREARLLFAQALRCELSGDAAGAARRYAELAAMPYRRTLLGEAEGAFVEWRLRAAGIAARPCIALPIGID